MVDLKSKKKKKKKQFPTTFVSAAMPLRRAEDTMILNLMHNQLHFSSRRSVAEQDIILCPQQHVIPVTKETRNKNQVCHDVFSRNGLHCQSLGCPSNMIFAFKFHITLKQLMFVFFFF